MRLSERDSEMLKEGVNHGTIQTLRRAIRMVRMQERLWGHPIANCPDHAQAAGMIKHQLERVLKARLKRIKKHGSVEI